MKKRKSLTCFFAKRVRLFGALLVVAFMFAGTTVEAQKSTNYVSTPQALEVLTTEIGDLLAQKANTPPSAQLENPVEGMKVMYYKGIALRLKEGMSTVDAVEANHAAFVQRAPAAEQTANILKTSAQALLD